MKNYTEDVFYMTIKHNLRKIRLEHKAIDNQLTTQVLSEMLVVSYNWLRDIEGSSLDKRPSLDYLRKFCLTLKTSVR